MTHVFQAVDGGELFDATTAELTLRARRGDRDAFGELIRRHERTALAVAFASTGDENSAGDVTQEAFLRAWRRLPALKDDGKFAPWLCCIVRNAAVDLRRKGRADRAALDVDEVATVFDLSASDTAADPSAGLERSESDDCLAEALAALDEASRTAVVLRYYEGLSSASIAELMMTTPAAIDMRLSRARAALKQHLTEQNGIAP